MSRLVDWCVIDTRLQLICLPHLFIPHYLLKTYYVWTTPWLAQMCLKSNENVFKEIDIQDKIRRTIKNIFTVPLIVAWGLMKHWHISSIWLLNEQHVSDHLQLLYLFLTYCIYTYLFSLQVYLALRMRICWLWLLYSDSLAPEQVVKKLSK